MPLRVMTYDVGEYERQAASLRKKNRKQQTKKTAGEFLNGFCHDDRLNPVVTLILYYGDSWDGPKDLHGMLDFTDIPGTIKS